MKRWRLIDERIKHEKEMREASEVAFAHERELRAIFDQHERELRLQNEAAVEKARALQFGIYEQRLEGMNEFRQQLTVQAATFVASDRFEREHKSLGDRLDAKVNSLSERVDAKVESLGNQLGVEHGVTIRQDTTQSVLDKISSNNRILWGVVLSTVGTFLALLAHMEGIIK